jgi:hypothetical protein
LTIKCCRHISYFTTGAFAFSGLVIFLLGVTYVGSYVGYTPTTGTGSSSNSLGPVGDGDVAPPPPPPPPPAGAPANTPSPAMAAFDTVPVYLWFPILCETSKDSQPRIIHPLSDSTAAASSRLHPSSRLPADPRLRRGNHHDDCRTLWLLRNQNVQVRTVCWLVVWDLQSRVWIWGKPGTSLGFRVYCLGFTVQGLDHAPDDAGA